MTGDQAGGFGGRLREARERRGLSLRDIASATRIPMNALQALERNDLARLPGGIFSRAFVRAYAVEVGLDPEALLKDFLAQLPPEPSAAIHRIQTVEDGVAIESERRTASTVLWMILISVPVAAALLYFGSVGRQPAATDSRPPLEAPSGTPAVSLPPDLPVPPAMPDKSPPGPAVIAVPETTPAVATPAPIAVAAAPRLAVAVTLTSASRITVIVDGKPLVDREFAAGERQVFTVDRNLTLTVADPSALELTLNGGQARPLGPAGETATIRLTPANYKTYLAVP